MSIVIVILVVGIITAFYMGWNIGANDLANSMGPAVGGGGLTVRRAVILGGVLTVFGAVLVGKHVTGTLQKGIVDFTNVQDPNLILISMLAALLGAATWSTIATYFGMPISTSHSIVGALVGVGIIGYGYQNIHWDVFGKIGASWIISPLSGAGMGFALFYLIKRSILDHRAPIHRSRIIAPILIGFMFFILLFSLMYQGLEPLGFDKLSLAEVLVIAGTIAVFAVLISYLFLQRFEPKGENQLKKVERLFIIMLVIASAFIAFAQGSHNVANVAGPLSLIVDQTMYGGQGFHVDPLGPIVFTGILLFGGAADLIGAATWGHRVIKTIGSGITKLTPSRAFAAVFGAAITILICSRLGFPISSSHIAVGGVIGVGLAGGVEALDTRVIRNIIIYCLLTVPMAAIFAIGIYFGISVII